MLMIPGKGFRYVRASEPVAYDYDTGDFTKDGNWHTLDMSAKLPIKAKMVHLSVQLTTGAAGGMMFLAPSDFTGDLLRTGIGAGAGATSFYNDFIVACPNQGIRYKHAGAALGAFNVVVLGWFL